MSKSPPDRSQLPPDPADMPGPGKGQRRPGPLPRCHLILLRDDGTDLMVIVRTIMEVTHYCKEEATYKMWEAHHSGRCVVLTTFRERAEFFAEQLATRGVRATVEPE